MKLINYVPQRPTGSVTFTGSRTQSDMFLVQLKITSHHQHCPRYVYPRVGIIDRLNRHLMRCRGLQPGKQQNLTRTRAFEFRPGPRMAKAGAKKRLEENKTHLRRLLIAILIGIVRSHGRFIFAAFTFWVRCTSQVATSMLIMQCVQMKTFGGKTTDVSWAECGKLTFLVSPFRIQLLM